MPRKSFEDWLKDVDAIIQARTGLSREDLPDIDYHSIYSDGKNALTAANRAIRNAKEY